MVYAAMAAALTWWGWSVAGIRGALFVALFALAIHLLPSDGKKAAKFLRRPTLTGMVTMILWPIALAVVLAGLGMVALDVAGELWLGVDLLGGG